MDRNISPLICMQTVSPLHPVCPVFHRFRPMDASLILFSNSGEGFFCSPAPHQSRLSSRLSFSPFPLIFRESCPLKGPCCPCPPSLPPSLISHLSKSVIKIETSPLRKMTFLAHVEARPTHSAPRNTSRAGSKVVRGAGRTGTATA